ncbi:MAG TPA: thioredoxin family protein [bacterium]|nr:thioredoxin family protein [bacterium]HPS28951.1 thioredoxin family protein [bacterium]
MLQTNLKHIETVDDFDKLVKSGQKIAVVCGRMGPMCIPVYGVMESLESKYTDINFRDMLFDSDVAMKTIRSLPETKNFSGLPFTVYFKDGKVVAATSSIQNKQQVKDIIESKLV